MPWRNTKDPYKVWLSEIILQQTRVDQGLPYYERFIEAFPTIQDLARSSDEKVLRLWQGLGYYSRARNLHFTAKFITESLNGVFPSTYENILKLKGIGPYTAAAIASICFDEPKPVVDGNVFRFASRYFGISDDISKASSRKVFEDLLADFISKDFPGSFNQAMMEYGATVCSPSPKCDDCQFAIGCFAKKNSVQKELPVKIKKLKVTNRQFNYLHISDGITTLMRKRENGIWIGLYEFPVIEGKLDIDDVLTQLQSVDKNFIVNDSSPLIKHVLSHQVIQAKFLNISVSPSSMKKLAKHFKSEPFSQDEILNLPKPKLIVNYLEGIGIKS